MRPEVLDYRDFELDSPVPFSKALSAKCLVVAIFQGAKWQSRGLEIHIIDAPDRIRLHYLHVPYSIGLRDGERDDSADDRPYAFVVLPASSKPILLENGNAPKDRNATWLFPGPGIPLRVEEPIRIGTDFLRHLFGSAADCV